jgi:membrane associated rhomboid family serine protease
MVQLTSFFADAVYRPFSAILVHSGLLHIAFNMLSFVPMGAGLERILGSVRYVYAIVLFATLNAILHTAAAYAVSFQFPDLVYQCSVGFSGILFAMIVVETNMSGVQSRR